MNKGIRHTQWIWWIALSLLPIVVSIAALCIGRLSITPVEVLNSVKANFLGGETLSAAKELTLWNVRMPRILLALLVGAGLSVSGCVFQSLFAH